MNDRKWKAGAGIFVGTTVALLCLGLGEILAGQWNKTSRTPSATAVEPVETPPKLGSWRPNKMPLIPFVGNNGQQDPAVSFSADTFAGSVFVTTSGELVYNLPGKPIADSAPADSIPKGRRQADRQPGWTLVERMAEAQPLQPKAGPRAQASVSRFIGNDPARWQRNAPTFDSVSLGEAWPGITVQVRAGGDNVEKIFSVAPGADVSRIRIEVDGAQDLRLAEDGSLRVVTGLGQVAYTAPVAWQDGTAGRRPVEVAYALQDQGYGFDVGDYDTARPLFIDPLLQSTYLGGTTEDITTAMVIHPGTGDVYVAGYTCSPNFPGLNGGAQASHANNTTPSTGGFCHDWVVARLNANLDTLLQSTYVGGSGTNDYAYALAVHPDSGELYVAGVSNSSDFPGTSGGAQPAKNNLTDFAVARLSADLTELKQATYLGSSTSDEARALAVDPASGDVYVAGTINGPQDNFPGITGGAQETRGSSIEMVVARLNADLTILKQSTFLGGASHDSATDIAIHPQTGAVYVAGETRSVDFPGAAGGAQSSKGSTDGAIDFALARLSPDLQQLQQSTYLGGASDEREPSLAIDPDNGDIYLVGDSGSADFPGTAGGAQAANGGGGSDFVLARLNAALTTLKQATYLGGNVDERARGDRLMAVHPETGDIYVAGWTRSDFPGTAGGAQATNPDNQFGEDIVIARLSADLAQLKQATYLGSGSGAEYATSLAIHPDSGEVYVAGITCVTDFPGTAGGAQSSKAASTGGCEDFVIARLSASLRASDDLDFGDAPAPYPTTLAANGARHFITSLRLGALVDAESDGQPNSGATGDDIGGGDDEDGVSFANLVTGETATLTVVVDAPGGTAHLDAWVDFNADGDWLDPGEHVVINTPTSTGTHAMNFAVPTAAAAGMTYARVRLASVSPGSPAGAASDGEVEDELITINEPAPLPTLSIDDASLIEGDTGTTSINFTVTLSASSSQTVSVDWQTVDGSATVADGDYQAASGTLSFAPGTLSKSVAVTVNGDTQVEADETFSLRLSDPVNATVQAGDGTGTIVNDDSPPPSGTLSFETDVVSVNEGIGTLQLTVQRSGGSSGMISVSVATADASAIASDDYLAVNTTLNFDDGVVTQTVPITIVDDAEHEPGSAQTFTVQLTPVNGSVVVAPGTVTIAIIDNDPDPTSPGILAFAEAAYQGVEGDIIELVVNRTGGATGAVSATVEISVETATLADLTLPPSTVDLADGVTSAIVAIPILNDELQEGDETFTVRLVQPTGGASLGAQASVVVTIKAEETGGGGGSLGGPLVLVLSGLALWRRWRRAVSWSDLP